MNQFTLRGNIFTFFRKDFPHPRYYIERELYVSNLTRASTVWVYLFEFLNDI